MQIENQSSEIRNSVMKKIERNERNYRLSFVAVAMLEALFLIGYLLMADLSDRLHVLLLFSTVMIYSILAMGLIALGTHGTRNTLKILKALEMMERES